MRVQKQYIVDVFEADMILHRVLNSIPDFIQSIVSAKVIRKQKDESEVSFKAALFSFDTDQDNQGQQVTLHFNNTKDSSVWLENGD